MLGRIGGLLILILLGRILFMVIVVFFILRFFSLDFWVEF